MYPTSIEAPGHKLVTLVLVDRIIINNYHTTSASHSKKEKQDHSEAHTDCVQFQKRFMIYNYWSWTFCRSNLKAGTRILLEPVVIEVAIIIQDVVLVY